MYYSKLISASSNLFEKRNLENCLQFNTMKFLLRKFNLCQTYGNFDYQQVTDGNKSALKFLFGFYRRRPSDSNFGAKIRSVG